MALIDKIENRGDHHIKVGSSNNLVELNLRETEILLTLIKTSQFKGEDVEHLYNLVLKLQNLYLTYKK